MESHRQMIVISWNIMKLLMVNEMSWFGIYHNPLRAIIDTWSSREAVRSMSLMQSNSIARLAVVFCFQVCDESGSVRIITSSLSDRLWSVSRSPRTTKSASYSVGDAHMHMKHPPSSIIPIRKGNVSNEKSWFDCMIFGKKGCCFCYEEMVCDWFFVKW